MTNIAKFQDKKVAWNRKGMRNEMTPRMLRFCNEYLLDGIGTQAAIRAGYSKNTANAKACELLKRPEISQEVKTLYAELYRRNSATIDELIYVLSQQIKFDIIDLYEENGQLKNIHDIPKAARMSVEEIKVDELFEWRDGTKHIIGQTKRLKIVNRQNAIKMLMQHFGAFERDNKQKRAQIIEFHLPSNSR